MEKFKYLKVLFMTTSDYNVFWVFFLNRPQSFYFFTVVRLCIFSAGSTWNQRVHISVLRQSSKPKLDKSQNIPSKWLLITYYILLRTPGVCEI